VGVAAQNRCRTIALLEPNSLNASLIRNRSTP